MNIESISDFTEFWLWMKQGFVPIISDPVGNKPKVRAPPDRTESRRRAGKLYRARSRLYTSYGARPQARAVNLSLTNFQRTAPWVRWRIRQAAGRTRGCPHGMADGQKPGGRSDESTDEIQECMKIRKFEFSYFHENFIKFLTLLDLGYNKLRRASPSARR